MDKYSLLECTLRDGGYITNWRFEDRESRNIIQGSVDANIDYIEVGYLNNKKYEKNTTQFKSIEQITEYLPENRKQAMFLAMADVQQFYSEDLTPCTGNSIDGIRVVFYKHQIEEALKLSKAVKKAGYQLFVQPMVTVDYTIDEYVEVVKKFAVLQPYAVSIVDSFGYMTKQDFRKYFRVLDNILSQEVSIGFHSHNNMNLAFLTAQDVFEYNTQRNIILDCSLYGMGRGAGNLNTELIVNYYNMTLGTKYDCQKVIDLISEYIMPIAKEKKWGYSPYLFITGVKHYHPNFACYLLDEHPEVSVSDFDKFLMTIPEEMKTKCKKNYVLDMWKMFVEDKKGNL